MRYNASSLLGLVFACFVYSASAGADITHVTTVHIKRQQRPSGLSNIESFRQFATSQGVRILREITDNNGIIRGFGVLMNDTQKIAFQGSFSSADATYQRSKPTKAGPVTRSNEPTPGFGDLTLWGLNAIEGAVTNRARSQSRARTSSQFGTKVCVVDTGVAWDHPALPEVVGQRNVNIDQCQIQSAARLCESYGVCDNPSTPPDEAQLVYNLIVAECNAWGIGIAPEDYNQYCFNPQGKRKPCAYGDNDHGTHVTGTIGARNIHESPRIDLQGVDPSVRILAAKVFGYWYFGPDFGYYYTGWDFTVAEGIWACMNMGAQVINMSLGFDYSPVIVRNAVAEAASAGIIIVASAGNDATFPADYHYPAAYPEVISVTALGPDGLVTPWSSRGQKTDFTAPGESILSSTLDTDGGTFFHLIKLSGAPDQCVPGAFCSDGFTSPKGTYEYFSGTSMAAPHVTGVASAMLSVSPWLDVTYLRGVDLGLDRKDQGQYGLINARMSVEH